MSWESFIWFALGAVLLWAAGAFFAWKERKTLVYACTLVGIAVFFAFILGNATSFLLTPSSTPWSRSIVFYIHLNSKWEILSSGMLVNV